MTRATLITLIVGVAIARSAASSQSASAYEDDQPIDGLEHHVGESRVETPQVVLQLKYDRGELNKIYLAQFRKGESSWEPSVPGRTDLCADLCHAGLGGAACGSSCPDMLPVGLQAALLTPHETSAMLGEPRTGVCPTLCGNQLGDPLCNCSASFAEASQESDHGHSVLWSEICDAFCDADGYTLGGCPTCDKTAATATPDRLASMRVLNTEDGWVAWCSVQCGRGHGGAACNCDRSPLQ